MGMMYSIKILQINVHLTPTKFTNDDRTSIRLGTEAEQSGEASAEESGGQQGARGQDTGGGGQ